MVLQKSKETKSEPLVNKQFASNIPTTEISDYQSEESENVVLKKSTETKSQPLVNKQFNPIISQESNLINSEITQNQQKLTSNLALTSLPKDEPVEPDSNTTPIPTESEKYTPPTSQQAQTSTEEGEPLVLVAEVVVIGVDRELEDQVYQVISTQPGRTTTRSQLQKDINAIFATGFFRNVKALPEDTPLGVRVTFEVEPNPVLNSVI
ncbi:POTRA domain-containing protein, partial [Hydrocoleum sp. CS-953]|uniref:POTRA domain-containing protein n=1 Tax=Hydrocoleum sp. CS-953 TaxID=1671698 RepID=UPI00352AEDC5